MRELRVVYVVLTWFMLTECSLFSCDLSDYATVAPFQHLISLTTVNQSSSHVMVSLLIDTINIEDIGIISKWIDVRPVAHVVGFSGVNSSLVFHDQTVVHGLLQLGAKIDLTCLQSFNEHDTTATFLYCSVLSLMTSSSPMDLLAVVDSDFAVYIPSDAMAYVHSSCQLPKHAISLSQVSQNTVISEKSVSFHTSHTCNLWWPLNHTDIFLNGYPTAITPLKLKQRYIFSCGFDKSWINTQVVTGSGVIDLTVTITFDILLEDGRIDHSVLPTPVRLDTSTAAYEQDSLLYFNPIFVDRYIEIRVGDVLTRPWTTQLTFDCVLDSAVVPVATFDIHQNMVTIPSRLSAVKSSSCESSSVCPSLSLSSLDVSASIYPSLAHLTQIPSRDDLGFVLSSLLAGSESPLTFVEVGVQRGLFAKRMLNTFRNLSAYIAVDPWKRWIFEEYIDGANFGLQEQQDANYQQTLSLLTSDAEEEQSVRKYVIREESVRAARLFPSQSLDVIYIDAMHHYGAVWDDMMAWWRTLKVGGFFVGHDYLLEVRGNSVFSVKPAVDKFAAWKRETVLKIAEKECIEYGVGNCCASWLIVKTRE